MAEQQTRARLDKEVLRLTVEYNDLKVCRDQAVEKIKGLENTILVQNQQATEKLKGLEYTIQVLTDDAQKLAEERKIEDVCNSIEKLLMLKFPKADFTTLQVEYQSTDQELQAMTVSISG